jgi:hypothetical protein
MNASAAWPSSRTLGLTTIGLLLLLGLALRTVSAGGEALWSDEALTLAIARWPLSHLFFSPVDFSAGLYYSLVKLFVPADPTPLQARSLSILFGLLAIPLMYGIGRRLAGWQAGVGAGLLTATSPVLIDYSQENRPYALCLLLILASARMLLLLADRVREERRIEGPLLLFGLANVAAIFTHFIAAFWILPAVLIGRELTSRSPHGRVRLVYLLGVALMLAAVVPELQRMLQRSAFGSYGWLAEQGWVDDLSLLTAVLLPVGFGGKPDLAANPAHLVSVAVLLLLLGWLAVGERSKIKRFWRADQPGALVLGALLAFPVLQMLFDQFITPMVAIRTLLPSAFGFYLLIAIRDRDCRWPVLTGLLVLVHGVSLLREGTIRPREQWGPAAQFVGSRLRPGDAVVVCDNWRAAGFLHARRGAWPVPVMIPHWQGTRYPPGALHLMTAAGEGDKEGAVLRAYLRPSVNTTLGWRSGAMRRGLVAPKRLWFIESGCPAYGAEAIRVWAGEHRERELLSIPDNHYYAAGIRAWLFELNGSPRPVVRMP